MRFVEQRYTQRRVSGLKLHPENAKKGDLESIGASVDANGFYGACLVQKSTGFILVGNHRFLAAKQRGAESVPCLVVDVTDAEARRIMLADNKTSDDGSYDEAKLNQLLQGCLDGVGEDPEARTTALAGTGYAADDLDKLVAKLQRDAARTEGTSLRGPGGTITYNLVFDSPAQQQAWYDFLKYLRGQQPDAPTIGSRLAAHIAGLGIGG